ncbi:MAG: endolytic transglycosylase MltG [Actinobacteria bacterium]|nr:endolytic transglycosylase MltG [Actinomycetota bacterium]
MSDLSILGISDDRGYDHDGRRRNGRRSRRRRRSGRLGGVLALIVILGLVAAVGYGGKRLYGYVGASPDYAGDGTGSVEIQVKSGDTAKDIAATLVSKGVVKSARAFENAATADPRSRGIRPGFYRLRREMSGAAALNLLLSPQARLSMKVTVPEGYASRQIFELLAKKTKVPLADFTQAAAEPEALGLPEGVRNVEGLLFPSTYEFDPHATAADMLREMVTTFTAQVDVAALAEAAKPYGLTWYQLLNVASLVEEEGITAEFGKVARVVYNRLHDRVRLGFDSTINYALGRSSIALSVKDTQISSLYNTYRHFGLPPTPISNPGLEAIQAAMAPPAGNWLYFVKIDKAGHSYFTANYGDFLAHKAAAQKSGVY